ncbi:hypothetical protein [Moorena sp. SIO3I6]|nr:hypothetical protein [Moorena sp. SIO3I6]
MSTPGATRSCMLLSSPPPWEKLAIVRSLSMAPTEKPYSMA